MSKRTSYFDGAYLSAEFKSGSAPNTIAKKALILVEGVHVDSNKVTHKFDADRIQLIADNTNRHLDNGGRVPWQTDHNKAQFSNIGDLEGYCTVDVITEDNLPNPRAKHLVGKVGIFVDNLVAKGKDACEKVLNGSIKTLSPGIDIIDNMIKEISATPTPAIVGLSTFKAYDGSNRMKRNANFALTFDEMLQEEADADELKQELYNYCDKLLELLENIRSASEEELQGQDPEMLEEEALTSFMEYVSETVGVVQVAPEVTDQMAPMSAADKYAYFSSRRTSDRDRVLSLYEMYSSRR